MAAEKEELKKKKDAYMEFLTEEGFRPKYDDDGDIYFKRESMTYYFVFDDNDPDYVRFLLPRYTDFPHSQMNKALEIVNRINRETKSIKVYIEDNKDNDVSSSIELLNSMPEALFPFIDRYLKLLSFSAQEFRSALDGKER